MATDAVMERQFIQVEACQGPDDDRAYLPAPATPALVAGQAATTPDRAALAAIRLLFDRAFYLASHPDVAATGVDPLDHFLTSGLAEGRSPCPLFDPDFYLHQPGGPGTRDFLFLHYLRVGIRAGLDPHPLLDAAFYSRQAPALQDGTNPLTHLLGAGRRENRRPNPLFDMVYYRRRLRRDDRALHPLIHYVLHGWRDRLQPHPLFDPAAYLEQRPDIEAAGIDPLAHYLRQGLREQARPHWLFDAAHYAAQCPDGIAPGEALLHFAAAGCGPGRSPNPLFDPVYYLHQHPDLATSGCDPFLHFLEFGLAENRDPHPLFDTWFYRSQNTDVAENDVAPFVHYVRYGAREGRDPNPFFPAARYLVLYPEANEESAGPLAHFLRKPELHCRRLSDDFDPAYYLACHPSCAEAVAGGMPPLGHYLSVGRAARLSPLPMPIDQHAWQRPAAVPASAPPADDVPATPILLVVQEASHGDIALCALRAVQEMAADAALSCRVVVRHDGPLSPAFAALVPTLVLTADRAGAAGGTDRMADILHSFRGASDTGVVIVTSAAMADVAALAERLDLGVLAWLHEMPVSIDSLLGGERTMRALSRAASRLLTNSEAARDALVRHYGLPPEQVVSAPDGVIPLPRGLDPREVSVALRQRLGLQPDALVVLGSGAIEFRNGTDLFIRVASLAMARARHEAPAGSALHQCCFLWIGGTDDPLFAALCQHDIDRLGLSDRVRLLGPQDEPGQVLLGADLFLQTARDTVAGVAGLEARSSGLPVVRFAGGSTGREAPEDADRLTEVAYLDLDAMADAVMVRGDRPARRTRGSRPAGPSWAGWHRSLRRLLAEAYGVPPGGPAPGERQPDLVMPPAEPVVESVPPIDRPPLRLVRSGSAPRDGACPDDAMPWSGGALASVAAAAE